jgi:hypothetical protein
MVVRVGSSIAAYSQDQFGAERFLLASDAWAYDSTVPTFEHTTSITGAHVVNGVELANGYLTISYRQAGGAWGRIPNPISLAGDEKYLQTSGGDMVAYAGGKIARLRPISDPTIGLQRCNGRDFQGDISQGPDAATLVLINTGPTCTFSEADERSLQFEVAGDWTNSAEDRRLTHGGLGYVVEPQGRVTVTFANVEHGAYPGPCVSPPPTADPIYLARFRLSSAGEPIKLKVTVPAGCVGLTFFVAPPRPPEPPTTTTIVPIPTDRWEALPDLPMKSTFNPLVVAIASDVLVVGGYGPSDRTVKTAGAIFDGNTWRVIPDGLGRACDKRRWDDHDLYAGD